MIPEPLLRVAFVPIVIFLTAVVFLVILLFLVWLVPKNILAGIEQSRSRYSGFVRCILNGTPISVSLRPPLPLRSRAAVQCNLEIKGDRNGTKSY